MASSSLGVKRHCQSCGNNYYDLNKTPITCSSCATVFDPEALLKSRRSKPAVQAVVKKAEVEPAAEIDPDLEANIDDVDGAIETDDDLTDDSDIVAIAPSEKSEDEIEVATTDGVIDNELDVPDEIEE